MNSQFSHKKSGVGSALDVSSEWDMSSAFSVSHNPEVLTVRYDSASDPSQGDLEVSHILAIIHYGESHYTSVNESGLNIGVKLPQFSQPRISEIWESSAPVRWEQIPGFRLGFTDETVFGCLEVQESFEAVLEDVARSAYEQIFEYCAQSGFPHLLRMWNYFPHINSDQNGLECYKRFCLGRHQAFSAYNKDFASMLPAATAVGTQGVPIQV